MSSIVLELQRDLLQKDCDILLALRKAHIIASKLQLLEFDTWIQNELNGYKCAATELPSYRRIYGNIKAWNPYNGWIPYIIQDRELEELFSMVPLFDPVASIIEIKRNTNKDFVCYNYRGDVYSKLTEMTQSPIPMNIQLHVNISCINSAIEAVNNSLLEWTLRLEKEGIKGDNMLFNTEEQKKAEAIPQQVQNYYGTVVNGNIEHSQVIAGKNHTINYNEAANAIEEAREAIEKEIISPEDKETALSLLEDISDKITKEKKPGIIKIAAKGLGSFLKDVGAAVAAEIVMAKIEGRF